MQNKSTNNHPLPHLRMRIRSLGSAVLAFLFMILMQSNLTAQITGTVVDGIGEPLIGVSIAIEGQDGGAATDIDGTYSISASSGDVLVFSYIGFSDQSITVGDQSVINVTMSEDAELLEEVVVIGSHDVCGLLETQFDLEA